MEECQTDKNGAYLENKQYTASQYRARTGFSLCSKFSQGKTCFHYMEPQFSLQGPCIYYREFPVRITTQVNPCSHCREWVCSVLIPHNLSYAK